VKVGEPVPLANFLATSNLERQLSKLAGQEGVAPFLPIGSSGGPSAPQLDLPRNVKVEAIGVYKGEREQDRITAYKRMMGSVEVRIRRSENPIVLVLSSYEPVHWILKADPGVELSAILVTGYYPSEVVGAGAVRVMTMGNTYAYKLDSTEFGALNREVRKWTGKDIGIFQGRYEGGPFSVGSIAPSTAFSQAKTPNQPYKMVADSQIALDEAVRMGVIRKATVEDVNAFRDAYIEKKYTSRNLPVPVKENALSVTNVDISRAYVVLKKFTYPSGMINENRVVFFVPKGVSEPSGEYGHSAIYHFDTLTVSCTAARTGGMSC